MFLLQSGVIPLSFLPTSGLFCKDATHMFLHPPLGPRLDQLPGLSHHIVYTSHTHTTAPFVNPLFTYCALNRVCLYCFPTDTTGPLSRVYKHLPTTFLHSPSILCQGGSLSNQSCSIVGAIITMSSAYSYSEGRPLLASLETTSMTAANNSGLSTDP